MEDIFAMHEAIRKLLRNVKSVLRGYELSSKISAVSASDTSTQRATGKSLMLDFEAFHCSTSRGEVLASYQLVCSDQVL